MTDAVRLLHAGFFFPPYLPKTNVAQPHNSHVQLTQVTLNGPTQLRRHNVFHKIFELTFTVIQTTAIGILVGFICI